MAQSRIKNRTVQRQQARMIVYVFSQIIIKLTNMQILQTNRPKKSALASSPSLDLQLQQALNEVKLLRQQNQHLLSRISHLQRQQQLLLFMRQQLAFRKAEEQKMTAIISHYQDITSQLNEKVKVLTQTHASPKELAPTTIDCASKPQEEFELELPITRNFRASCAKRTSRSDSSEKHKENHAITPKSRVNIDLSGIFEDRMPIKKKVFL